jgi:menaquinone-dependent protoporphyrinogen oxidase
MANLLLAYDTLEGQTRKIAQRLAEAFVGSGHQVRVIDLRKPPAGLSLDGYDALLVGASVHFGKHSRRLSDFVHRHQAALETTSAGFFSVSLSAAGTEKERSDARRFVEEFLRSTGWRPTKTATFAGGLLYRDYGLLKRWMMKKIARDAGKDTDTSRNHEYTDWNAVEQFASEFLSGLDQRSAKP